MLENSLSPMALGGTHTFRKLPAGCDAVISSLGHTLTLRGMYGAPRKLCTDTVRQLCRVAELLQPMNPIRLIAISTEGARPGFTQCAQASHSAPTACTACTACIVGPAFLNGQS